MAGPVLPGAALETAGPGRATLALGQQAEPSSALGLEGRRAVGRAAPSEGAAGQDVAPCGPARLPQSRRPQGPARAAVGLAAGALGAGAGRLLVPQQVQLLLALGEQALEAEVLPDDWQQLLQQVPLAQTLRAQERRLRALVGLPRTEAISPGGGAAECGGAERQVRGGGF